MDTRWSSLLSEILRQIGEDQTAAIQQQLMETYDRLTQQAAAAGNPAQGGDKLAQQALTQVLGERFQTLQIEPGSIDALFELMIGTGLYRLALTLVLQQQQHLPSGEYHLKHSIALFHLGEHKQAEAELQQAIALIPDHYQCHFQLGYQLICQGKMERAMAALERCLELNPEFAAAHQNLAGCLCQNSEFERAVESCWRAHELKPGVTATYITAASACLAMELFDDAQWWLDQAASLELNSSDLLRLQGLVSHFQGKHQIAVEQLSDYLAQHPRSYKLVAIRARSRFALQCWPELLEDTQVLLQLDPFDEWSLEKRALALYHSGNSERAEEALNELIRLYPNYKHLHRDMLNKVRQRCDSHTLEKS